MRALLRQLGIAHEFEYVRKSGSRLLTRPTSRTYYEITLAGDTLEVTRHMPDLQKCLIELHKGHGPLLFKDFQKFWRSACCASSSAVCGSDCLRPG